MPSSAWDEKLRVKNTAPGAADSSRRKPLVALLLALLLVAPLTQGLSRRNDTEHGSCSGMKNCCVVLHD
ncbi:hypothetical protein B296_00026541 [Ensete ventricosum]|uniref:Uncharacterized protein n=1 Tax=Ensete ventricosum TaxID=4639 RepID=A0A426Z2W5_ENSVE|nr:hypothetical protein B296_00026541 [Ensete ventricosum]